MEHPNQLKTCCFARERREFTCLVGNFSQNNQLKLVVADILENGNFILKDASNRTCKESFDFPVKTILPSMILERDHPFFLEQAEMIPQ
ncbi:unnamed protein product [Brassica rapa subsp. trilocularis]